ncbi:MAG: hypothetical protein M3179_06690 [Actinomycetota bacterium]|nr:hypothetical protein [Actinomycetota bacterium]
MEDQPRDDRNLPVPFDPDFVPDEAPEPGGDGGGRFSISRRRFLSLLAAGAAVAATDAKLTRGQLVRRAQRAITAMVEAPAEATNHIDFLIHAERDVDLVLLDFEFIGFDLQPGNPPRIVPKPNFRPRIIVRFPPQAIGEAVYHDTKDGKLCVDPAPILSDVSDRSQLVFGLPADDSIPLPTMSVADLLDWSTWRLEVTFVAQDEHIKRSDPFFRPVPSKPNWSDTQIECPYALILSPTDGAVFDTRLEPTPGAIHECWTAVLNDSDRRVVATWSHDYPDSAKDATPYTNIAYFASVFEDPA